MYKYIGGEFGRVRIEKTIDEKIVFCDNVKYLMSGRTAMHTIMKDILAQNKISSVYMPSYCSRSMIEPIHDCGLKTKFYPVNIDKTGIIYDYDFNNECDCIILMDYFGYCSEDLPNIAIAERKNGKIIVVDITQSLLCDRTYENFADYTLVSYRKWLPSSAAKAYSSKPFVFKVDEKINSKYETLRNSGFATINDEGYCSDILDNSETILRSDYIGYMASKNEISYVLNFDYHNAKNVRRKNAINLTNMLKNIECKNIQLIYNEVKQCDCPLYVPIIIGQSIDRNKVLNELISQQIECYIHWGFSKFHNIKHKNDLLYTSELSLFCDQRYDDDDMKRIVEVLNKTINMPVVKK